MSLGGKVIPVTSVRLLAAQGPRLGGREKRMVKVLFTRTRGCRPPGLVQGWPQLYTSHLWPERRARAALDGGDLATYRDRHRRRTQRTPSSFHFPTLSPIAESS